MKLFKPLVDYKYCVNSIVSDVCRYRLLWTAGIHIRILYEWPEEEDFRRKNRSSLFSVLVSSFLYQGTLLHGNLMIYHGLYNTSIEQYIRESEQDNASGIGYARSV